MSSNNKMNRNHNNINGNHFNESSFCENNISRRNANENNIDKNKKTGMNNTEAMKNADNSMFQSGDINSKRIFENPYLCAQFLREYSGLDILKDVQPEDIEPVKLRYHIFEDIELNSDSVVRVRQETGKKEPPLYVIPLIDHKSRVDYNVGMQLLYYMVCIWRDWEKEMDQKYHLDPRTKDFRYPFIYPIVYYEGTANWTAPTNLGSRIAMSDSLPQYVPDFQHHVVRIHDYADTELLIKNDEMSLLMLLNKIQRARDLNKFQGLVYDEVDKIVGKTPETVLDIIAGTARSLCRKLNIPEDETNDYISKIRKERKMGYLFENMEKIDIQEERRLLKEERRRREEEQKLREEEQRLREEEQKLREEEQRLREEAQKEAKQARENLKEAQAESSFQTYVEALQEFGVSRGEAKKRLIAKYDLEEAKVEVKLSLYWKE